MRYTKLSGQFLRKFFSSFFRTILSLVLFPMIVCAEPVSIDFENLPDGTLVNDIFLDKGIVFQDTYIASNFCDLFCSNFTNAAEGQGALSFEFVRQVDGQLVDDPVKSVSFFLFNRTGAMFGGALKIGVYYGSHSQIFELPENTPPGVVTFEAPEGFSIYTIWIEGHLNGNNMFFDIDDLTFDRGDADYFLAKINPETKEDRLEIEPGRKPCGRNLTEIKKTSPFFFQCLKKENDQKVPVKGCTLTYSFTESLNPDDDHKGGHNHEPPANLDLNWGFFKTMPQTLKSKFL